MVTLQEENPLELKLVLGCKYVTAMYSLGAESRKKSYAKHFGYKLATGLNLKKNEF